MKRAKQRQFRKTVWEWIREMPEPPPRGLCLDLNPYPASTKQAFLKGTMSLEELLAATPSPQHRS